MFIYCCTCTGTKCPCGFELFSWVYSMAVSVGVRTQRLANSDLYSTSLLHIHIYVIVLKESIPHGRFIICYVYWQVGDRVYFP